jgi:hypothetical protein
MEIMDSWEGQEICLSSKASRLPVGPIRPVQWIPGAFSLSAGGL